jgi:hypothetical protein
VIVIWDEDVVAVPSALSAKHNKRRFNHRAIGPLVGLQPQAYHADSQRTDTHRALFAASRFANGSSANRKLSGFDGRISPVKSAFRQEIKP